MSICQCYLSKMADELVQIVTTPAFTGVFLLMAQLVRSADEKIQLKIAAACPILLFVKLQLAMFCLLFFKVHCRWLILPCNAIGHANVAQFGIYPYSKL